MERIEYQGTRHRESVAVAANPLIPEGTILPNVVLATAQACTQQEQRFAELFVAYRNQRRAFREAYLPANGPGLIDWENANKVLHRPWVLAHVRAVQLAATRATVVDVAALLERDKQIVEGSAYVGQLVKHIHQACRWCCGVGHEYQWIDSNEYAKALAAWMDAAGVEGAKPGPQPNDAGGYGFSHTHEPAFDCPKCEGRGVQHTIVADTTRLEGPAAAIYKGVKVTANGIEVLLHDADKAAERLYRAAGAFGDDAASVARGAAAGAAAGASMAKAAEAIAAKVGEMGEDEVRRKYLEMVG